MKSRKVYLCGVAWQHELGHTEVTLYPSLKQAKAEHTFYKECGIVELDLGGAEPKWAVEQKPVSQWKKRR